jgi:hypothetical protein
MPRVISTISARSLALPRSSRLRPLLFLNMVHFLELIVGHHEVDRRFRCAQQSSTAPSQSRKLVVIDVRPRRLGEALQKNGPLITPIGDHRAITSTLASSLTRNALLDETIAQVGVNKPPVGVSHRLHQECIRNSLASLKARESLHLEDSHEITTQSTIVIRCIGQKGCNALPALAKA